LGGAAAAEGQGAVNALDVNGSSFGRVRSRPAKIIKGAKKAAYYPKALFPSRSLALTAGRRSILPAASSYREVLTAAQQAKANAARAEAKAARPGEGYFYAVPRLALHPFLPARLGVHWEGGL
jgi:hypothetical protein